MITFDYGGGRGGLADDYVIKDCKIFGRFLQFSSGFLTKNLHNFQKVFQNFLKMKTFNDKLRQRIFM